MAVTLLDKAVAEALKAFWFKVQDDDGGAWQDIHATDAVVADLGLGNLETLTLFVRLSGVELNDLRVEFPGIWESPSASSINWDDFAGNMVSTIIAYMMRKHYPEVQVETSRRHNLFDQ